MHKIRTIIADGRTLIRECLRAILEKHPTLEMLAEAADGLEAVRLCEELQPGLAVLDLRTRKLDGVEATRRIRAVSPATKVMLLLSMPADKNLFCEAVRAGASGFLLNSSSTREMFEAIGTVAAGARYITPALRELLQADGRKCEATPAVAELLTPREQEILVLLAQGKTSRKIAELLGISSKTVETHRTHLMKKLNLTNIASLTKYAIREGLLPLD